jgi:hypothetical protein
MTGISGEEEGRGGVEFMITEKRRRESKEEKLRGSGDGGTVAVTSSTVQTRNGI